MGRWETLPEPPRGFWSWVRRLKKPKYFIDECLGQSATEVLRQLGHNVTDVWEQGLAGQDDSAVFQRAWKLQRILLTHDTDYWDDRRFPENSNAGVIILPGAEGDDESLVEGLAAALSLTGTGYLFWRKSKIIVTADGVMRIKNRSEDGKMTIETYRFVKGGRPQQLK